ncbi:hypothetical protein BJ684DRAFT_17542 [Piptocephalis cylindrospora]|uniref:Uncharacterized protein n=1 Tax=Piptocephalis cylindrospora TaxID=1907219 RepID=A0A4P9XZK6_9FUNG|nr:hypothetical protein BJ684DRAFT_17542 [Piptocephalis cylindrospora]|eukprot:RKP11918.1 hypothetical protein BJ684DRAFT_17542 [Piptocephalis cylindrospora]
MSSTRPSRFHTRREVAEAGALRQVLYSPVQRWQKQWVSAGEGKVDSRGKPIHVLKWVKVDLKPEAFEEIEEDEEVVGTPSALGGSATDALLSPQGTPGGSHSASGTPLGKITDSPGLSATASGVLGDGRGPMDSPSHAPGSLEGTFQDDMGKERELPSLSSEAPGKDETTTPSVNEISSVRPPAASSNLSSDKANPPTEKLQDGESDSSTMLKEGDEAVVKIEGPNDPSTPNDPNPPPPPPVSEGSSGVKDEDAMDTSA